MIRELLARCRKAGLWRIGFFIMSFLLLQSNSAQAIKITSISVSYDHEDRRGWYFKVDFTLDSPSGPDIWYHFDCDPGLGDPYNGWSSWQISVEWGSTSGSGIIAFAKQWDHVVDGSPHKLDGRVEVGLGNIGPVTASAYVFIPIPEPPSDAGQCDDEPILQYSNGGFGLPALYIAPTTLNMTITDMPLWYKGGDGPDIQITVVYHSEVQRPAVAGSPANTQYYPLGQKWSFSYAPFYRKRGENILVTLPDGRINFYEYDTTRAQFISPKGVYNKLEKTGDEYILTFKVSKLKYHFSDTTSKKLTAIEDRNGNLISLYYDADYNLDYLTDGNGRRVEITLDHLSHRITEIRDPIGRTATFTYNEQGYLQSITDMGGYTSTFGYEAPPLWNNYADPQRITSMTTPWGTTRIQYEVPSNNWGPGNTHTRITVTNALGYQRVIEGKELADNKWQTTIGDFAGNASSFNIDRQKNCIVSINYPTGVTINYGYDAVGNRNRRAIGNFTILHTYDANGNVTGRTSPLGHTRSYVYDADDNLISTTDPMGNVNSYSYDQRGSLTSIMTQLSTERFSYDNKGKVISATNPNGNVTTYQHDNNGYLSKIVHPLGPPTIFVNDPVGRSINVTSNGVPAAFEYDKLDNMIRTSFADGSSENFEYKVFDRTKHTDPGGRTTSYEYDAIGQLISTNGLEGTISYTRDRRGKVTATNINGQVATYAYDNQGRKIQMTNPDGTSQSYAYDELGNRISRVDENGTKTTYTYNYNLLTKIDYSDNTPDVSYTYNANGQVTSMIDGIGTTTYKYSGRCGRLVEKDGLFAGDRITYTYDATGNRTSMSVPGMQVTYTYDALNRLMSVTSSYASVQYEYDAGYNYLKKMTYGNGTYTEYVYDNMGRLISLQNKKTNDSPISGFALSYDNASNMVKIVDQNNNISMYEYDYGYRLIDENVTDQLGRTLWHNKFTYDIVSNMMHLES